MKILHLSFSPRGQVSESHGLSQKIVERLLRRRPGAMLTRRFIGDDAVPHVDEAYATALGAPQHSSAELSREGTFALSEELIAELEGADAVVVGTPMHNLTVPSALKAWLDHVVRVRRTFDVTRDGKVGLLRDRPVFVAVSSGGRHSGDGARQPDFLTPYLTAVLGMIGLHDVTFFSIEGTALGSDALEAARSKADRALEAHFAGPSHPSGRASFRTGSDSIRPPTASIGGA